jgi:hypothetical protein
MMSPVMRAAGAVVIALAVGVGLMMFDTSRGAEWEVSPQQIEEAKSAGGVGYQTRPGSVAVLPIRSETADILPFKWLFAGLGAGALFFVATRRRA